MKIGELVNGKAELLNTFEAFDKVRQIKRDGLPPGLTTGWPKFDQYFKFPPMGNLNVVTGAPGSGKSEWVDSLAVNMVKLHNWKVFYYSPENFPPEYHIQKLCEKYTGKPFQGFRMGHGTIDDNDIDNFERVVTSNFAFINYHINNADIDSILKAIMTECVAQKVNMVVVDPWNKLSSQKPSNMPQTEFIGRCLTKIQMFSRQRGISFWIVAHPAKPMKLKDGSMPSFTLYDISDSSHWYNMVDNGFIINRSWDDKVSGSNFNNIKIAKIKDRRYGKCGEHQMEFIPATGHFQEVPA